jgi:hypothetical protein
VQLQGQGHNFTPTSAILQQVEAFLDATLYP